MFFLVSYGKWNDVYALNARKGKEVHAVPPSPRIRTYVEVTVVNDTKDYEIPVMQVVVGDVAGDVTRANGVLSVTTTMSLFAEYYNEALTVWEPVLEKWEMELTLVQEPRDRVVGDSSCHEL